MTYATWKAFCEWVNYGDSAEVQLMQVKCAQCGWEGQKRDLEPRGSIARYHCPKCPAKYADPNGVMPIEVKD